MGSGGEWVYASWGIGALWLGLSVSAVGWYRGDGECVVLPCGRSGGYRADAAGDAFFIDTGVLLLGR